MLSSNDASDGLIKHLRGRNPPNFAISDSWVFKKFILDVESFAKVLQIFKTCSLVNNILCEKLVFH